MPALRQMLGRHYPPSSRDILDAVIIGGLEPAEDSHGLTALRLAQVVHGGDGRELE